MPDTHAPASPPSSSIDTILASVMACRFKSITQEMSVAMTKTTRSPILCEARDFVTGLYDGAGNMLEQTEHLPILSFSLAPVCKYLVDYYGGNGDGGGNGSEEIYPGDVIFHNDVFSLGNQNNDVAVFKPIFVDGERVGWAAAKGHQADIGGAVAGGYNPNATEVWQEALRIPPVKVYEKGRLRRDVWDLIFANIRFPMVAEDLKAQMGACTVGERGLVKLVSRYGIPVYNAHKQYLFDATEKMMRAEIAAIPDGTYKGEATVYYDGRTPGSKYQIRVTVTVTNDDITFDYSNTDPQTDGFVNSTYTSSASATLLTFLQMVNPHLPHNEGMVKPLRIIIPEGTLLNARFPAATTFGNHLCPPNADAIIRALSQAIPERVTAGWNQLLCQLTTGLDPRSGESFVDIGFMGLKGGSGATEGVDGYDHIGMIDASGGILDQDYEMFEQQTPHRLLQHEFLTDSAGAGRWRGGLGVVTTLKLGGQGLKLVTFGDGDVEPAFGLFGGGPGSLNRLELHYPDGKVYQTTTKDLVEKVPAGTLLYQMAGGGGGYGDPRRRDPALVRAEVRDGLLSKAKALGEYGLVTG